MKITLRCKNCSSINSFGIDRLDDDNFYKCSICGTHMTLRESTIITNIEFLDNFEVMKIEKVDSHLDSRLADDLEAIQNFYLNGDDTTKEMIYEILDKTMMILHRENINDTKKLNDEINALWEKGVNGYDELI